MSISKAELKKRKGELSKFAREELAKTEVMRFRLNPTEIMKLCELAEKKEARVGVMVRQWVLERMQAEANPYSNIKRQTLRVSEQSDYDNFSLSSVLKRLDNVEAKVKKLCSQKLK